MNSETNFLAKKSDAPQALATNKNDSLNFVHHNSGGFAFALHAAERRQLAKESKAKRDAVRVPYAPLILPPAHKSSRVIVSVDSSKAKSNIDVLRLSLKELGWREVSYSYKCHC